MNDGKILLDTLFAKKIGFTSDKFKDSWLWKVNNYIYLSMIWSKKERQGYTTNLIDNIIKEGYGVKVPTPFTKMVSICVSRGFRHIVEEGEDGQCDVLIKEPKGCNTWKNVNIVEVKNH